MGAGSGHFLRGAGVKADKKIYRAGAVKPFLVGGGAGKNPLKTAPNSCAFLEPVNEIYKNGSN